MTFRKWLARGAAFGALACLAGVANAQSTATQVQEVVVTGSRQAASMNGLATQVQAARDESVVNQQYIQTQIGTQNFAQLVNLLPGVTYASEDPTGILSGDFRIHGLDCAHLSITIDGSPVNDTGNYACYPGEYLVAELTDHVTVDMGATSVDSPTASAVGGTVDVVSKVPTVKPGFIGSFTGGSDSYKRGYAELESGAFGPWGARAYLSANVADGDKWKGEGYVSRQGVDARVYQPLYGRSFVSLAGTYVKNRAYFYYSGSPSDIAKYGRNYDYNTQWVVPTIQNGHADTVPNASSLPGLAGDAGSDTNYWALHPNPVDFGTLRGQSLFDLGHGLTLTVDPSYFYTVANGGGATGISECDLRLKGTTGKCVDLNGDGDTLDTVPLFTPNTTQTDRFVLTSSLLWDIDEHNHLQFAYTRDHGRHRQTGEYTYIDLLTGDPLNVYGGKKGYGVPVLTSDGAIMRGRDRFSIASLNQFAINYIGQFLDDRLHVNVGVRDPHFERNLNQFCDSYNGTSFYCTTVDQALIAAAYQKDVGTGKTTNLAAYIPGVSYNAAAGAPNLRLPYAQTFRYHKVLPNAGVTYRIGGDHLLYASYSAGFSAPKTDDLYTSTTDYVLPETSDTYTAGYRYQAHVLTASLNVYDTEYKNRIVQSYDPNDPTISIDRNVGNVRIYGFDGEVGVRPIDNLTLYGSVTLQHSEILDNYYSTLNGHTIAVPTKGKQFVMTPEQQYSMRAQYSIGDFTVGFDGKYMSKRYVTDLNDASIPGYAVFDFDASYVLPMFDRSTSIKLNVYNLFDKDYISRSTTTATDQGFTTPYGTYRGSNHYLYLGAPRSVFVTLRTAF